MAGDTHQLQIDLLALLSSAVTLSTLALTLTADSAAQWLSTATPAIVFFGYWALVARRLVRVDTVRWIAAYPLAWRRAVATAAVVSGLLALPLMAVNWLLSPVAWVGVLAGGLAIYARAWFALGLALVTTVVSYAAIPHWWVEILEPGTKAVAAMIALVSVCVASWYFASRSRTSGA